VNKIEAIVRPEKFDAVKTALAAEGFTGLNVIQVTGRGAQVGITHIGRAGEKVTIDMLPKTKLEVVVKDADTQKAIDVIVKAARTGSIGDGKIFVMPVSQVVRVRTGETGEGAL
jgi:nitrogen regulatory protein P-II 1